MSETSNWHYAREFFEMSEDLFFVLGFDGYVKRANSSALQAFGKSEQELFTQPLIDMIYLDDQDKIRTMLGTSTQASSFRGIETRFVVSNGLTRTFLWSGKLDAECKVYFCVARDVSDLRNHQQFLAQMVDILPVAVFCKDSQNDFRFNLWNFEASRLWKLRPEQAIGKNDYDFFPEDQSDAFRAKDEEVLKGGRSVTIEEEPITLENGQRRLLRTRKAPLAGRYLVGISEDITETRQLYRELASSKERLELAISSGGFGTWDWDVTSNVLVWDDTMHRLFGTNKTDFSGKFSAFTQVLLPEDAARVSCEIDATFRLHKNFSSEFRIRWPDGQVRIMRTESRAIYNDQGSPVRLIGMNWDVTDEREQEAKFVQASKMSSLGEMSAGIAHEINNPLAIISGWAEQIDNMVQEQTIDTQRVLKHTRSIQATVDRIAKIVKSLRAFARDGSRDPFETASVADIIADTLSLCSNRFELSGVRLEASPVQAGLRMECRSEQVSQILLNLLNNAYDAVYSLSDKWTRIEVTDQGHTVEISVTDSGRGIPKHMHEKLIQPFFTTKEVGRGTGLGLSIAAGLAKAHHGSLEIDSACLNTRFTIRLPKVQPVQAKDPRQAA